MMTDDRSRELSGAVNQSPAPAPVLGAGAREALEIPDEMVENGCRGMYGKHWDGPIEKMPGEEMKVVWRKLSKSCLSAALADTVTDTAQGQPEITKGVRRK